MEPNRISVEERNRITDAAANLFKVRNPQWFPCLANSDKLCGHLENQLGFAIVDYPYPITVEMFQVAHDQILQMGGWFYPRPIEEEVEDPAVVKERAAQQRVRDQYDAQQAAAKMQRDRNMPLQDLGKLVSVQNADLREQRDQNILPGRPVGQSSRPVSNVTMGLRATARANAALANPSLPRDGAEFSKKYAEELRRLRSE
jgi:hypothetical protein